MGQLLPPLRLDTLKPTCDRLRDAALVLSSLQRGFLPEHPRQWQYGLEVTMRGLGTQAFMVNDEEVRAGLDLVRRKVRLDGGEWRLKEYDGPELFKNVRAWLESKSTNAKLDEPKFGGVGQTFDSDQATAYAEALWWFDKQFRVLKAGLDEGVTSPVLLYPHHFDLSLAWFPYDDERQLSVGWSTGDETIKEPYVYMTTYPEPAGFTKLTLPIGAYWQTEGFSGAILPYAVLQSSQEPEVLFRQFAGETFAAARPLFD
jgi:hypothetical protein